MSKARKEKSKNVPVTPAAHAALLEAIEGTPLHGKGVVSNLIHWYCGLSTTEKNVFIRLVSDEDVESILIAALLRRRPELPELVEEMERVAATLRQGEVGARGRGARAG